MIWASCSTQLRTEYPSKRAPSLTRSHNPTCCHHHPNRHSPDSWTPTTAAPRSGSAASCSRPLYTRRVALDQLSASRRHNYNPSGRRHRPRGTAACLGFQQAPGDSRSRCPTRVQTKPSCSREGRGGVEREARKKLRILPSLKLRRCCVEGGVVPKGKKRGLDPGHFLFSLRLRHPAAKLQCATTRPLLSKPME